MHSPAISLTDPPGGSPIAEGVTWIQSVALGTTATAIAVLAVAAVGLLMLSGRLELRRSITVVTGCFILFGAGGITGTITRLSEAESQRVALVVPPTPVLQQPPPTSAPSPTAYDPYAGASVPTHR